MRRLFSRDREVLLETATRGQARMIATLHARCFERQWGTAEIAELLAQDTVLCLVVRLVGKPDLAPLAFAIVRNVVDEAEILSIGVDPKHRRRGLARKLMEEIVRRLHGERTRSLFLEVDQANKPATGLYQQMKFQIVAERPAYYNNPAGDKSTALVMRLDLV